MSKEQIIRELENCMEFFSGLPYRREALQIAIQCIKDAEKADA